MEDDVINSRFEDFQRIDKWLKEVRFKETIFGIELNVFNINNTLKIKFLILERISPNLEGIKERLTKICN
jgi:hypothetical protein